MQRTTLASIYLGEYAGSAEPVTRSYNTTATTATTSAAGTKRRPAGPDQERAAETSSLNDNSASPSASAHKRKRVALACTSCRSRKSRCDGQKPSCGVCHDLGFDCVYQHPAGGHRRRPLQANYGDRLESLERLIGSLSQPKNGSAATIGGPSLLSATDQEVAVIAEDEEVVQDTAEDFVDGMAAITSPEEQKLRFFGPSSNVSFLRHISRATTSVIRDNLQLFNTSHAHSQPLVSRATSPLMKGFAKSPSNLPPAHIYALPPEECVVDLIRLFFLDTGMMCPWIDEQEILRTYYAVKRRGFTGVNRDWLSLINMIFAFAVYLNARPDLSPETNATKSQIFFERAQALCGDPNLKCTNIQTVQTLLLMSQYCQGTQRSDLTWHLHGSAVAHAIHLGLHCSPRTGSLPPLEEEVRKRIWFGCVILDRHLSITFGRPPAIPNEFIKLPSPVERDLDSLRSDQTGRGGDEEKVPSTASFFVAAIGMARIHGDIVSCLYGQNLAAEYTMPLHATLQNIVTLERQLDTWAEQLPDCLKRTPVAIDDISSSNSETTDQTFDRLSLVTTVRHHYTRVLIHRPVLNRLLGLLLTPNSSGGPCNELDDDEKNELLCDFSAGSLRICLRSAIRVINSVAIAKTVPSLLGAWWFSAYYTFNAALVVFGCFMIKISGRPFFAHFAMPCSVSEMMAKLHTAADAIQCLGQGMKTASRLHKTLERLQKVCTTLSQYSPFLSLRDTIQSQIPLTFTASAGSVALSQVVGENASNINYIRSADGSIQQPRRRQWFGGDDMGNADTDTAPQSNLLPEGQYASNQQHWTNSDLEFLADLGELDDGLTAMLGI